MSRLAAVLLAGAVLLGACGDDDDGDDAAATTTTTAALSTTTAAEPTTATTAADATTTTAAPAGDPLDAAAEWVATYLPAATVTVSEFRQGDARSGEVDVLRPREGGGTANAAATLLLRLDEADEWQVIGAANPNVTIDSIENGAEVPAGPITVSGVGRGFEATIVVRIADGTGSTVAEGVGMGGAFAEPEPYEVELDLTGVASGSELVVVASGGTGLEGDPGEFSAIVVHVA